MFQYYTDLALSPMTSPAAGTSYGVRPISTFKTGINGGDRVSFVNSTTSITHITFTWKRHGFSCMTGLKRSRRLSITSMAQAPRGANFGDKKKIIGSVVLMKKKVLDLNDINASVLDRLYELFNRRVSLQLISAVNCDPSEFAFLLSIYYFLVLRSLVKKLSSAFNGGKK